MQSKEVEIAKQQLSALGVLRAARRLLASPKAWTQGEYARDRAGRPVAATQRSAVCWCPLGALQKVSDPAPARYRARAYLSAANGIGSVSVFNDASDRTHKQILAWFSLAIKLAQKEQ